MGELPWLSPTSADVELNTEVVAERLRAFRKAHGLSQADLAQILHLDQSYVSNVENGQREVRDLGVLLRIANRLDIPPSSLGVSEEVLRPVPAPSGGPLLGQVDPVRHSQDEWRRQRRDLNARRSGLARVAASLYKPEVRVGRAPFLAREGWMPRRPVPLESIRLRWRDEAVPFPVSGTEPEAHAVLPLRAPGRRYERYSSAIRYLAPPALFENRPSYRLLDVELSDDSGRMEFGLATYFDKIDLSQAAAHELAVATGGGARAQWGALPLRALVGDPFDLRRRAVTPAIGTLTLRRERRTGEAAFFVQWRDPARVATSGGLYGLVPSGEFQPSTIASWDRENDFDLWRNVVREYSEELLGEPERDGSQGAPLDYGSWPLYRDLEAARADGRVRVHCLGIGVNALTLSLEVLTAVVIDDDVFDEIFADTATDTAEGVLVSTSDSPGVPFDEQCVRRLVDRQPMASGGACVLERAWRFRGELLGG